MLKRNGKQNTKDSVQCHAISAPTGQPPLIIRTLWTIVAHRYWDLRWKDPTSSLWRLHAPIRRLPNWVPPWTATQSFQDDQYGLGRMRELEESFLNVGFNPYGLNQSRHGMPGPGRLGDGFMWPGANGSPSDSGNSAVETL